MDFWSTTELTPFHVLNFHIFKQVINMTIIPEEDSDDAADVDDVNDK